jgi:type II secretory pathway component PulF
MKIELPWRQLFGRTNSADQADKDNEPELPWRYRKRLYQHMSNQISNGLGITDTLKEFRDRLQKRGRKGPALAVHRIYRDVVDGKTLVEAMQSHMTDLEKTVIGAGERGGTLPKMLDLLLDIRERTGNLFMGMLSSFFAPTVYLIAMYAALLVIGIVVIPQFTESLPVRRWTGWAYVMYLMGEAATGWFAPVIVAIFLIAAFVIWRALPRWTGEGRIKGRVFCDRYVFPFTVYREMTGFAWLLSYTALVRGGLSNVSAIREQMSKSSPWLASRLLPLHIGLREGNKLSEAMDSAGHGFPSLDLIDEISSYAKFGNFEEKIETVAKQHSERLLKVLLFKGVLISLVFSMSIFFMMATVQLGANSISNAISMSY